METLQTPPVALPAESWEETRERRLANFLAWAVPLLAYFLLLAFTVRQCERLTGGSLVYALDDAYIHMSVAKTLLAAHSYGLQPHQFSSPESSILWPFLVALGFLATGSSVAVPLLLNIIFSVVAILGMGAFLARLKVGPVLRLIGGLLLVWLTPLVPMSITGMEHVGQCASVLIFAGLFALTFERDRDSDMDSRMATAALACAAAAMVLFRYEGLFVAFAAAVLLAWKRRWTESGLILLAAGLPAAIFALWLRSHGHFFLPDSMIVKCPPSMAHNLGQNLQNLVGSALAKSAVCLVALVLFVRRISGSTVATNLLVLMVIAIHLLAASLGWFYRYEAYLVALLTFAAILTLRDLWENTRLGSSRKGPHKLHPLFSSLLVIALLVNSWPLLYRGTIAHKQVVLWAQYIYLQQVQMAQFFGRYYRGRTIALNDIGAVGFFAQSRIFDVYGLASHDVAQLMQQKKYTTDAMAHLAAQKGVEAAAVFEYLFSGGVPMWIKAGSLDVQHGPDRVSGRPVSFYAMTPCKAVVLASHLKEFQKTAPAGVLVSVEPQLPYADCRAAQ